ncbi:MAG: ribonuclease P protein component 1 [Candidatus Heimdallarchaeaceae archaeon]
MKPNTGQASKILKIWGSLATSIEGLPIEILKSSSKELEGIRGTILNETSNMIKIRTVKKDISIQKRNNVFKIQQNDGSNYIIDGNILIGLPEARIKKRMLSW